MFGKTQQGSWFHAWRFDGETAVPAAMYIPDPLTSNAPPAQDFSARWTGFVSAPITGSFTISATSDDGIRVSIDGKMIIDHWDTHGPTEYTAELDLVTGKRLPIVIEYFQGDGGCGLSLAWRLPSQKTTTTIPASALTQDAEGLKAGMAAEYFAGTDLQKSVEKRIDAVIDYPVLFGNPATPTFSRAAEVWPAGRPTQPCIWMDRNGDGAMQADEYVVAPRGGSSARVDQHGDIVVNTGSWDAGKGDITIIPCTGTDARGMHQWDVAKARSTPIPTGHGLEKVSKLSYDADNDRMYIGAWTDETPYPGGGWEQMCCGPALFCFDAWSTKPTFVWRTSIIPPEGLIGSTPKAWSFEPDYAFVAYSDKQTNGVAVDVYRLADGSRFGRLLPNGAVGNATGLIDMNDAVQSHRRADGTYAVFAEEVWMAKGLFWLWKP